METRQRSKFNSVFGLFFFFCVDSFPFVHQWFQYIRIVQLLFCNSVHFRSNNNIMVRIYKHRLFDARPLRRSILQSDQWSKNVSYLLVQTCFDTPLCGHHQFYLMMSKVSANNISIINWLKDKQTELVWKVNGVFKFLTAYSRLQRGSSCEHKVKTSMATSSEENWTFQRGSWSRTSTKIPKNELQCNLKRNLTMFFVMHGVKLHKPLNEGSYVSSPHRGPGKDTRSPLILEFQSAVKSGFLLVVY